MTLSRHHHMLDNLEAELRRALSPDAKEIWQNIHQTWVMRLVEWNDSCLAKHMWEFLECPPERWRSRFGHTLDILAVSALLRCSRARVILDIYKDAEGFHPDHETKASDVIAWSNVYQAAGAGRWGLPALPNEEE